MNDSFRSEEYAANWRVSAAFNGEYVGGPSDVSDEIAALLRSEFTITREVRDILAAAFDRGRGGYRPTEDSPNEDKKPRLVVENTGLHGKIGKAVRVRRKWFDAGAELCALTVRGREAQSAKTTISLKYSLDFEALKKAAAFYKRFEAEVADPDSRLRKATADFGWADPDDRDFHGLARGLFIEREAEEAVGVTYAQLDGDN